jgi:methylamine dehydrogenase accessory protein MauD
MSSTALLVALALQWVFMLALGIAVLALVRQVGVLHARFGPPPGALMVSKGIKIGERSPEFTLRTIDARDISIGAPDPAGRSTLIMFVAPECPVCAQLLPALRSIGTQESAWLRLVFASDGDPEVQRRFWQEKGLGEHPYVLSHELGLTYQIGRLPYGVLIDPKGVMTAQGLCNSREHVESLFEAQRLGVSSIQDFLQREQQRANPETVNS